MNGSTRVAADRLWEAAASRTPCGPVRELIVDAGSDPIIAAYQVQQYNVDRACGEGRRLVGRKIGLTSAAVQRQLGVDQPDFGALFAETAFGDSHEIDLSMFIQPKVEAEVALVLHRDLPSAKNTIADVIVATAFALAAVEIVDSRVANWEISLFDTIADNASAGGFVLGTRPLPLTGLDLRRMRMRMLCEETVVSEGSGVECLGNPLNAAVWLANRMATLNTPLRAGDIVLTGALGRMVAVQPGCTYAAEVEGLGSVCARFSYPPSGIETRQLRPPAASAANIDSSRDSAG